MPYGEKLWRIWQMTINSPNFPQPIFMILNILKHIAIWGVPSLLKDTRQNLAVVAHSHAHFVHKSCAVAMHYMGCSSFIII